MTSDSPGPVSPKEPLAATRSPANTDPSPHQPCPACASAAGAGPGGDPSRYIYALGQVQPRYPSLSAEKEIAQVIGRAETAKLTDRQVIHQVLARRQNRYLARQLCWVLAIQGLDTYLLQPRDPADLDLLIEALRPEPSPQDQDVVVGVRGPIAPPEMCNGLMVPVVIFDQLYSFDRDAFIKSISRPDTIPEERFRPAAAAMFDRIIQMTGNVGAADEQRALNYLAVRYPAIYARTAEAFSQEASLSAVNVRGSQLGGLRRIVEVILSYTNRKTDVTEKFFVRVDVTEEFPFLVTKLTPYFDR